ncbi:hypothetical protein [Actinoplanes sp. NPDC023714]|uniref:hypothetical protein n=1 Tax=Actinoplanes sp. NPDC023714 TaxID=3154322 RepID=UPI0033DD9FCB
MNLDDLARDDIAAALRRPAAEQADTRSAPAYHGADDSRQAARERSGRDRSGRAAGSGGGRSYAFRRS